MAKKALLVGCNYPGTKAELKGCINDVKRMHECLLQRYGFSEEDITVLIDTDDSYTEPTGKNVRKALADLIRSGEPGDVLFFHYSGHGTRLPAETGEDDDTGYDECIVPSDMNLITDDDFRDFVDNVPHGCRITIVSDSCHSGGLIDEAKEQIGESTKKEEEERESSFKGFLQQTASRAFESRGIHLPLGGHRRHHDTESEQEEPSDDQRSVSRSLPLSTLIDILKEKTGKDDIDVGKLRPALFDIFGEDSSPKVKKFMKFVMGRLQQGNNQGGSGGGGGFMSILQQGNNQGGSGGGGGFMSILQQGNNQGGSGGGGGLMGMVGNLAQDFLKQKLEENDEDYAKPAAATKINSKKDVYAGSGKRALPDGGILVSGCQTNETSADANPSGKAAGAYGALSNAIQTIIAETDGTVTNQDLVLKAREILKRQGFTQRPGLYCSDNHADAPFIC